MKRKTMTDFRVIIYRLRAGDSLRQIHRCTKIHRTIIRAIHRMAQEKGWLSLDTPIPDNTEIFQAMNQVSSKKHLLQTFDTDFEKWLSEGMDVTVMFTLIADRCNCSISTVRRYLKKRFPKQVKPIMIRQTIPGKYMDVDFGELGVFLDENGALKKVWVFSGRLRHSRKAYREIVLNQKAETFFACHIQAFEEFGGVPQNVVPDNLKAAVIKSTIDNEGINRSYQQMAEHYGFLIDPCLPFSPEHKGGVERDMQYVKRSFLPWFKELYGKRGALKIKDLIEALKLWEKQIDHVHLIYGVEKTPQEIFSEEKNHLKSLPLTRWQITSWHRCLVRRDWRIMYDSAYYSVPYRLIGEAVDVCITSETLKVFYNHQEVALHQKAKEKWEYKRKTEHAPALQEDVLRCTREGVLMQAEKIGPYTKELCLAILDNPKIDKLRPVRCILRLALQYSEVRLEKACRRALEYKLLRYESVKAILKEQLDNEEKIEKVVPIAKAYRFARSFNEYETKTQDSRYGTAMLGTWTSKVADQILDEEKKFKEAFDE